jgi:predicted amino acid dehydrogenase
MKAVIQTIEVARKALNPKLIGLTAYAAFSGNKGEQLAKMLNVSLTTGSNYTLAMLPESILRAAEFMEINLQDAHILLIGATSSVGRYAIEILSHFTCGMFITAHNEDKLGLMLTELPKEKKSKLHRPKDLESVLDKVSIVIIASNRIPADFDLNKLNPGTVIFDASYPRLIFQRPANDLMIIDGVSIKSGNGINYNFDFGLPGGLCFPCMAEPMILALERKFNSYSLGKDFEPDKIREILRLGAKHGFEIATLTSREKVMAEEQMLAVKHNAEKKKKRGLLAWR